MVKSKNKAIVFAASEHPEFNRNSPHAYRSWLWVHLIATDKTYIYINPTQNTKPMIHYSFYDEPLGKPLDSEAIFNQATEEWTRRYEAGTIRFKPSQNFLTDVGVITFEKNRNISQSPGIRETTSDQQQKLQVK